MRRTRLSTKRASSPPNNSNADEPKKSKSELKKHQKHTSPPKRQNSEEDSDGSSSDSDLETYLKPADEIDLNSSFFQIEKSEETKSFAAIENNIFAGINRLSDSESEAELEPDIPTVTSTGVATEKHKETEEPKPTTSKINFQQLHDYTNKLEEAKKLVAKYEASKKVQQAKQKKVEKKPDDISNLLALGETKIDSSVELQVSMHSSDYESYSESEKEDWEEVEEHDLKVTKENIIPKDGVQITVALPEVMRKKKGIDLVACMKRRLNRIRKENQVLVHKVHLLCWLGHGNYVNQVLNNEDLLAMALSLLPSQHCYPANRTDLSYLEQIVKWYKNAIPNVDKLVSKSISLEEALKLQITRKQAYNKKMLVYIFICILRSLGIQCRLVLSFHVAPIRPPASELHSLSIKSDDTKDAEKQKGTAIETESTQNSPTDKKDPEKQKAIDSKTKTSRNATKKNKTDENVPIETEKSKTQKLKKPNLKGLSNKNETQKNDIKDLQQKLNSGTSKSREKTSKAKTEKDNTKVSDETRRSKSKRISSLQQSEGSPKEQSNKKKRTSTNVKINSAEPSEDKETGDKPKRRSKSTNEAKLQSTEKKPDLLKLKQTRKTKSVSEPEKTKMKEKQVTKSTNNNKAQLTTASSGIPQLDGANDSDDEPSTSQKQSTKLNLKKLSQEKKNPCPKNHPKRLKSLPRYKEESSDDDFEDKSPRKSLTKSSRENIKSKSTRNSAQLQQNRSKSLDKEKLKVISPKSEKTSPAHIKQSKELPQSNKSPKKPAVSSIQEYITSKSPNKKGDIRNDIIAIMKGRMVQEKAAADRKLVKNRKSQKQSDDDSDYAPEPIKKKHHDSEDEFYEKPKIKVKQRVRVKKENDTDEDDTKKRKGVDVWVEVFLENEEKWISADVVKGQVHCVNEIYSRASHPITYIVAWNNDNSFKDITQRYCPNWNTVTRKLRIDKRWWEATLKPFMGRKTARDREEDEELARLQLEKPLPATISEYKNHPLYALKRHLLKFEAIYPPDAVTLGFVRNEPVYSRDCVHVLHSREMWLKEAKVVRAGEQPYKIVKARPKWDKLSGQVISDLLLELFGKWQVEDYVPPTAENGIVPKNAYGNVELFKPCMLPKGTIHLQLPGLNKVARKLNIDCVSAVVGFDFHGGWNHAIYDGFVVCEEFTEILIAAWHTEQEEQEKREQEKIEKRVYSNWKKLIKGLLIRERLKARYNFGSSSETGADGKKRKSGGSKVVSKKRKIYSDEESD